MDETRKAEGWTDRKKGEATFGFKAGNFSFH